MKTIQRKSVEKEQVGRNRFGPIYVVRIIYEDDRESWGCSQPGCLSLFGAGGEGEARRFAKLAEKH